MNFTDKPTIRKAEIADLPALISLCRVTFFDTYHEFNKESDMAIYMNDHFSEEALLKDLMNPLKTYFVADTGSNLCGYLNLTEKSLPEFYNGRRCLEIARYYVHKNFQGRSIGKLLMNTCFEYARNNNFEIVWLGVWQKNIKALEVYFHQGFEKIGTTTFLLGADLQEDFILSKQVN